MTSTTHAGGYKESLRIVRKSDKSEYQNAVVDGMTEFYESPTDEHLEVSNA
jgi:hypothetical protein